MEYDIESILEKYEDDYNPGPRPMDQEPRTMNQGGRIPFENGKKVSPNNTVKSEASYKVYEDKFGKELFESMEKTMDKQSFVPKTVTQDDIAKTELMIKNKFFGKDKRKLQATGGLATMLGE